MARKKNRGIFTGLEKTTTLLRFAGALGGMYFLYYKYQQSQRNAAQDAAIANATAMASEGATKPLTAAGLKVLPSPGASPVAYQGASPDQVNTTRQLNAPQAQSLDPNEVAAKALTDLVSKATERFAS